MRLLMLLVTVCLLSVSDISTSYARGAGVFQWDVIPGSLMLTDADLDMYGCFFLETKLTDKFPSIDGVETMLDIYKCREKKVGVYRFANSRIYAVATKINGQSIEACIDEDGLGYCTILVGPDEDFVLDFSAYGVGKDAY